ncbi:MAG: DUF362 domain-containing protein [Candidatus Lokiarchaeota archaeon]|nr:DUF362 domain-containing protein [Candidatus Lokiarchaeota archaeon]
MTTKISIVHIEDYKNIQEAIIKGIELIEDDFKFKLQDLSNILLKPNLLRATEDACTQPSFVEGVLSYLTKKGIDMKNVSIGDSPGQIKTTASKIAKKIGLYEVAEKKGVKFVDFEKEVPIHETIDDAIVLKDYYVSKPVKDCDLLINLPKLKTHGEATITGAIKNYWGIIPGGLKAKFHLLGKTPAQFGDALADNYAWVIQNKPFRLTVYDLEKVMYGSMGPVSGAMKEWNLLLVGTDELALDVVALAIGKFKGLNYVPHLKSANRRNLGIGNLEDIEIVGISLEEAKKIAPKFKMPRKSMTKFASLITGRIVYKVTKKVPIMTEKKCKKCGMCAEICPAHAIDFIEDTFPEFNMKECISCLCCLEVCPHQAIKTKARGFKGLFYSY